MRFLMPTPPLPEFGIVFGSILRETN